MFTTSSFIMHFHFLFLLISWFAGLHQGFFFFFFLDKFISAVSLEFLHTCLRSLYLNESWISNTSLGQIIFFWPEVWVHNFYFISLSVVVGKSEASLIFLLVSDLFSVPTYLEYFVPYLWSLIICPMYIPALLMTNIFCIVTSPVVLMCLLHSSFQDKGSTEYAHIGPCSPLMPSVFLIDLLYVLWSCAQNVHLSLLFIALITFSDMPIYKNIFLF